MDATEAELMEKIEHHLQQATKAAAEIQTLEQKDQVLEQKDQVQGDQVPHFDQIDLPAHALGQRFSRGFSRAIQEERTREVALAKLGRVHCPDCKEQCRVETEPVAHCRPCRWSYFPSAGPNGLR